MRAHRKVHRVHTLAKEKERKVRTLGCASVVATRSSTLGFIVSKLSTVGARVVRQAGVEECWLYGFCIVGGFRTLPLLQESALSARGATFAHSTLRPAQGGWPREASAQRRPVGRAAEGVPPLSDYFLGSFLSHPQAGAGRGKGGRGRVARGLLYRLLEALVRAPTTPQKLPY